MELDSELHGLQLCRVTSHPSLKKVEFPCDEATNLAKSNDELDILLACGSLPPARKALLVQRQGQGQGQAKGLFVKADKPKPGQS